MKLPEVPKFKRLAESKLPKRMGTAADLYYETKQMRLLFQKLTDELRAQETTLKDLLINVVPKSNATGIAGKVARAQIVLKSTFRVTDWDKVYAYILRNKAPELLQRRLSTQAIAERIDAGKPVPGVEDFQFKDVSLNKL